MYFKESLEENERIRLLFDPRSSRSSISAAWAAVQGRPDYKLPQFEPLVGTILAGKIRSNSKIKEKKENAVHITNVNGLLIDIEK